MPFEHWVSRLVVRTCLDALRAERRRPELRWADMAEEQAAWLEFMVAEESAPPATAPESARKLTAKPLARLSPDDRLVISLLDLTDGPQRTWPGSPAGAHRSSKFPPSGPGENCGNGSGLWGPLHPEHLPAFQALKPKPADLTLDVLNVDLQPGSKP